MKANESQIVRAIDKPDGWRAILLHGPDEGGSRTLADRLGATIGPDAERVDLDGATLKADPALLADEATAMTMFGGPRWVRVTGGDEVLPAVEALLEAAPGCPVAVVAGQLKPASALLKFALASPAIHAFASYKPDAARADALAIQIGRPLGVRLEPDAARALADATAGDRVLMLREIEKLALYLDASPDRPRIAQRTDFEAIGAAIDVREAWDLVDALFDGKPDALGDQIAGPGAAEMIPALRSVLRRTTALARARAGLPGKLFNMKEKEAADRQARHWQPQALVIAHREAMAAEAALKRPGSAGEVLAHHALIGLARAAERRR